jgi:hypothetical protein
MNSHLHSQNQVSTCNAHSAYGSKFIFLFPNVCLVCLLLNSITLPWPQPQITLPNMGTIMVWACAYLMLHICLPYAPHMLNTLGPIPNANSGWRPARVSNRCKLIYWTFHLVVLTIFQLLRLRSHWMLVSFFLDIHFLHILNIYRSS